LRFRSRSRLLTFLPLGVSLLFSLIFFIFRPDVFEVTESFLSVSRVPFRTLIRPGFFPGSFPPSFRIESGRREIVRGFSRSPRFSGVLFPCPGTPPFFARPAEQVLPALFARSVPPGPSGRHFPPFSHHRKRARKAVPFLSPLWSRARARLNWMRSFFSSVFPS